jgi:hypothetical protein
MPARTAGSTREKAVPDGGGRAPDASPFRRRDPLRAAQGGHEPGIDALNRAALAFGPTEDRGRMPMPVLMIGEVPNLTEETYGAMVGQLMPLMRSSKGFISHAGGPSPSGGWRVVEVWESEEDGKKWFEENVTPNLPPDVVPDRKYYPLHTAFTK